MDNELDYVATPGFLEDERYYTEEELFGPHGFYPDEPSSEEEGSSPTSSSPRHPPLPIEICEMIIDYVAPEPEDERGLLRACRATLRVCMAVCRAWGPRCLFHLMEEWQIDTRTQARSVARIVHQFPAFRHRIKCDIVNVLGQDKSWVSMIMLLLPPHLDLLELDSFDLQTLHPIALQRFYLLKIEHLRLSRWTGYRFYHQIARMVKSTSAWRFEWFPYIPLGPGVVRGLRTSLKEIELYGSVDEMVELMRHVTVFSSSPLSIRFILNHLARSPEEYFAIPTDEYDTGGSLPKGIRAILPRPVLADLPKRYRALWNSVFRVWQMHCCRNKDDTLLESLYLAMHPEGSSFELLREFRGETFDETGPSTLVIKGKCGPYYDDLVACINIVIRRLSLLDLHEVVLKLSIQPKVAIPVIFECLDDAFNLPDPDFAALSLVTLHVTDPLDRRPNGRILCALDHGPKLFPRTYARGLIQCTWCEIHNPLQTSDASR
ncbi:hypothetical protein EIP91_006925 [Steccherinum ochraceum]|uniref:F-box domain-containing protein n=1 Tax=Steccherinum ochraceum TaxID=92696 RepID=A0A4R0R540_9APHY|nr:hypothetical protein EIP91_006925 [Steccherinum ochraceum]